MKGDSDLLLRYAEASSQADFAEFVARHIHGVYHAALRQLDGDVHRAKDVTQLVFCDVARKAHSVARHPEIVSWLHKSTHYAAANVRRTERSRQKYEHAARAEHTLVTENTTPARWDRLRPLLDAALLELNPRDREAVLLRFFENRSFAEVGAALELGESGARMRVERALDKLRAVLATRGLASTAAALAAVLESQGFATAPAGLASTVTAAAVTTTAAGAGALTSLWYLLGASKAGVSLATAAVLATTAALYQTRQMRAAEATLVDLKREQAMHAARLAELKTSVATAEQQRMEREAALAKARSARAAAAAVAAQRASARAQRAQQERAMQQALLTDPELKRLRIEDSRLSQLVSTRIREPARPLEELERAAAEYAEEKERQLAEAATKLPPQSQQSASGWNGRRIVEEFCTGQFYIDDPLTPQQVDQLEAAFLAAKVSDESEFRYARFDWDRLEPEAERILTPKQMECFRKLAALARTDVLMAAAARAVANVEAP